MGEVWHTGGRKVSPMVQTRNWSSSGDASIFRDGDDNACPASEPMRHALVVPSTIGKHNRPTIPFFRETHHGTNFNRLLFLFHFMGIGWVPFIQKDYCRNLMSMHTIA